MALPSIRAGLDTLRANPLRTLLSTLGVIMGAASLVAVLSLGDGAEAFARQRILQEGYNHVVIEPITADQVDGQSIARASVVSLTPADADAAAPIVGTRATGALFMQGSILWTPGWRASAAEPAMATARATAEAADSSISSGAANAPPSTGGSGTGAAVGTRGAAAASPQPVASTAPPAATPASGARGLRVVGLAPVGAASLPLPTPLAAGRMLTPHEARDGAALCVVSQGLATLLVSGDPATTASAAAGTTSAPASPASNAATRADAVRALGQTLTVAGRTWRIVGVQEDLVGQRGFTVVLPLAQAAPLLRAPQPRLVLEATKVEDVPALTTDLRAWTDARDGWRGGVRVSAPGQRRLEEIGRGIMVFKMLMGAFTAIALIVGGIGIMNVLLASVVERTREIGIRKAVGARRRDILTQFLTESVAIAAAGSLVGLAIGLGGAFGATAIMRARTAMLIFAGFSWGTLAASAGAALLVGLVFGTYPALRAARLSPIDAITRE